MNTAFILEPLCAAMHILREHKAKSTEPIIKKMDRFIVNAGDALKTGGIHTPNHRWVVSAALSQINELYPSKQYVTRINEWLSEGVYQDKDGHYPERSMTYSYVENNSFLTMGRLLERPALFEPVRKNLELTYFYMEPDGTLVTTDSRRQDQYTTKNNIVNWYLLYRFFAIIDNNGNFAAIAKMIESNAAFQEEIVNKSLFYFLENPILQKELPASIELPTVYDKLFTTSSLARIRRGATTVTIFGGVDWPMVIASGRSNSPNIFSYRKGNAILKYLRLSSNFFSTGYFHSNGLKKENDQYILQNKLQVPYYQPLPPKMHNKEGDYALSPSTDGRFWNKMAFDKRPTSNIKNLDTKLEIAEKNGKTILNFSVTGMKGVEVTIELCFKEGGQLKGIESSTIVNDQVLLEKGEARYECNGDTISFGPGKFAHKKIEFLEGEQYSSHFGNLRTEGVHVYITGVTPFEHQLLIY